MDRKLMEDLFFKLLETDLNFVDRSTIHEYFLYKTLDALCEHKTYLMLVDEGYVVSLIDLFEHFEGIATKMDNAEYAMFFFSLAQLLTLKFGYVKYEGEVIDRTQFEQEFKALKKKYKLA